MIMDLGIDRSSVESDPQRLWQLVFSKVCGESDGEVKLRCKGAMSCPCCLIRGKIPGMAGQRG